MSLSDRSSIPEYITVPLQLLVDAQQKGYLKKVRLFLLLKLMFPSGKTRLSLRELQFVERVDQIKSRKTTINYLNFLHRRGWIVYNSRTGYYILKSFDRIREENNWKIRWAIPVGPRTYRKLKAVTGAVIYGYLHKDFHRKLRKKKSVLVKGGTYHFRSSSFSNEPQTAPVSVYGAARLFNISVSTASRLKKAAEKENYLQVEKNYGERIDHKKMMMACLEYNDMRNNIVYHQGNYHFQLIDSVFPLFLFTRRKKLKP